MPQAPDYDFYEVLEIEQSATAQEIRDSYRRLALIHHPDKNPGDEEATARFQRIGLAHETLSDSTLRARYDNRGNSQHHGSHRPQGFYYHDDEDGDDDEEEYANHFARGHGFFSFEDFFGQRFREPRYATSEEMAAAEAAAEAHMESIRRAREAERQANLAEVRKRMEREESILRAKEQKKRDAGEMVMRLKEARENNERALNEKHWLSVNAVTAAEKQQSCLHSEFWPKEQQKRKFKCGACGKKAGMTAFKCPHCSLLSCQTCLGKICLKSSD